jgi:hypothetical protein
LALQNRVDPFGAIHAVAVRGLAEGAMITLDSAPGAPLLAWEGALWPWSFTGYGEPLAPGDIVASAQGTLLTPPSVVEAFRAGYRPAVHPSCGASRGRS